VAHRGQQFERQVENVGIVAQGRVVHDT
jgi:hypothetical protein